ncbi:hypothetical protein ES702_00768 [subsurface metagenome]
MERKFVAPKPQTVSGDIRVLDLLQTQGLFMCPHCRAANKIMVFATLEDLKTHIRKGCISYRYRR